MYATIRFFYVHMSPIIRFKAFCTIQEVARKDTVHKVIYIELMTQSVNNK